MYENQPQMKLGAAKFYEIARFPKVIGAIDCTLIKINSPGRCDAEIHISPPKRIFCYQCASYHKR
jgi:hypothetical protein